MAIYQYEVNIGDVKFALHGDELGYILGPCQIESRPHAFDMAQRIKEICDNCGVKFVYKSSFDKANRTSLNSPRGVGRKLGLQTLYDIKRNVGVPVLTDVHTVDDIRACAEYGIDAIQIPAFLCRQTDLLLAAAEYPGAVNIKKGQFLAPDDTKHILDKATSKGNKNVMICERGTSFGYNTLVNDMTGLKVMSDFQYPVIFDATHSVQKPGALNGKSGGNRDFAPILAKAAVATGFVSGVFMEVHNSPDDAPSDGANMIKLENLEDILLDINAINQTAKQTRLYY